MPQTVNENHKYWVNNYNTVHNTNTMGSAVLILSMTMMMNSVNVSQIMRKLVFQ